MNTTFWMIIVITSFIAGLRFNKTVLDILLRIFFIGFAQMACKNHFYGRHVSGKKIEDDTDLLYQSIHGRKKMFLRLQERIKKERQNNDQWSKNVVRWDKDTIKSEAPDYRYNLAILLLSDRHKIAEKHLGIDFLDAEE